MISQQEFPKQNHFQLRTLGERIFYPLGFLIGLGFVFLSGKTSETLDVLWRMTLFFFCAFFILFVVDYFQDRKRWSDDVHRVGRLKLVLLWFLLLLGASIFAPVFMYGVIGAVLVPATQLLELSPTTNRTHYLWLASVGVLAIGLVLYWIRVKFRFAYGATEAAVGVIFAVYRIFPAELAIPPDPSFYLALLTASVYLVVRGADNMHQGWNERKDPLVRWVLRMGIPQSVHATHSPPRRLRRKDAAITPRKSARYSKMIDGK
jgi:hypothetical protein